MDMTVVTLSTLFKHMFECVVTLSDPRSTTSCVDNSNARSIVGIPEGTMGTITCTLTRSAAAQRRTGAAQRARGPGQGVRLTHRGRRLVTTSWLVLAVGAGLAGSRGSSVEASTASAAGPTTARITIAQGHTLWQIARTVDPQTDPRITIERIREINGLPDSSIRAGQELLIPVA